MEIALTLPGVPRTKKTSNRIVMIGRGANAFHKILPSEAYEAWFKDQMTRKNIIRHQLRAVQLPLTCKVEVTAQIYREADVGDLLGYEQAIADLLQDDKIAKPQPGKVLRVIRTGIGIIADDKQIISWDGSRALIDKARPRVDLVIRPAEVFSTGLFGASE